MPDPSSFSDAGAGPEGGTPPGMPRWVKVFGLVALVVVVLVVGVLLFADGDHGPRRHVDASEQLEPPVAHRDGSGVSAPSGG